MIINNTVNYCQQLTPQTDGDCVCVCVSCDSASSLAGYPTGQDDLSGW